MSYFRYACRLLLCLLATGCMDAEAGHRHRGYGNPGSRGGRGWVVSPLENPTACTVILGYGQSLMVGSQGAPALSTTDSTNNYYWRQTATQAICPLREGGTCVPRSDAETMNTAFAETAYDLGGFPESIIYFNAASAGTPLSGLVQGQTPYDNMITAITDMQTHVAANPDDANCSQIVVRAIHFNHGQSDEATQTATYEATFLDMVDDLQTDISAVTGQTSTIQWLIDQNTNWGDSSLAVPLIALDYVSACRARNELHCVQPWHQYAFSSTDYLHGTNVTYRHAGGVAGARARDLLIGGSYADFYPSTVVASGTNIEVCYSGRDLPLVLDTTTCPSHPVGDYGFELANENGEVLLPSITSVAVDGNCIDLTTDVAAQDWVRVRYAYTADWGTFAGSGCNTNSGAGPPFGNLRDSASDTLFGGESAANWALTIDDALTSGGVAAPTSEATHHISLENAERITVPDDNTIDATTALTLSWWQRNDDTTNNEVLWDKNVNSGWWVRRLTGVGMRVSFSASGAGNFQDSTADIIPASGWTHIMMTYNAGTVNWYIDCVLENGTSGGSIPASLTVNTTDLTINGAGLGMAGDYLFPAMWLSVATEAQVIEHCRAPVDPTSTTMGNPAVAFGPNASDDTTTAGGVLDWGTNGNDATCTGCEAGDLVTGDVP